jgi:hypothetical protein
VVSFHSSLFDSSAKASWLSVNSAAIKANFIAGLLGVENFLNGFYAMQAISDNQMRFWIECFQQTDPLNTRQVVISTVIIYDCKGWL